MAQCTEESDNLQLCRGHALIIINENFANSSREAEWSRRGRMKDLYNAWTLFKILDFKTTVYVDLKAEDIKRKVKEVVGEETINKNSECFALVINSLGQESKQREPKPYRYPQYSQSATVWKLTVMGTDRNAVEVDDLVECIHTAKHLKGKPKLLFLQISRNREMPDASADSEAFDKGVDVMVMTDSIQSGSQVSDSGDSAEGLVGRKLEEMGIDLNIDMDFPETKDPTEMETDSSSDFISDLKKNLKHAILYQQTSTGQGDEGTAVEHPLIKKPKSESGAILSAPSEKQTQPKRQVLQWQRSREPATSPSVYQVDITGIEDFPDDFLVVYPVTFGRVEILNTRIGSRLFHTMAKLEHVETLLSGGNILKYLSQVARDVSLAEDYVIVNEKTGERIAVKTNIFIQHRLSQRVTFLPKTLMNDSIMQRFIQK